MADNYLINTGACVSIAPVVNGVRTGGFVEIGDTGAFSISTSQDRIKVNEGKTGLRNVVHEAITGQESTFSMSISNVISENLRRGFYGTNTDVAADTGVTVQEVAYGEGQPIPLGKVRVSNVTVAVNGGSGDLVLDTDYSLDAQHGSIKILSTATHTDLSGFPASTVTLDIEFDHEAQQLMSAFQAQPQYYALRFEAENVGTGDDFNVTLFNVLMYSSNTLELLGTSQGALELEGRILKDTNGKFFDFEMKDL